jgi:Ni,Fe-hydrogenase maturation factor
VATEKNKILVFGNVLLKNDSIPLRLVPKLRESFPKIEFKEFDPNDDLEKEGKTLNIIDSVEGIKKVVLINEIDSLQTQRVFSMHDFDLAHSLKLLKKTGYVDSVNIFGVPMEISEEEALIQLKALIKATLS